MRGHKIVKYGLAPGDTSIGNYITYCAFQGPLIQNPKFFVQCGDNNLSYYKRTREDLKHIAEFYHDPLSWYTGQFMKYILRYNSRSAELIAEAYKELNVGRPYVG